MSVSEDPFGQAPFSLPTKNRERSTKVGVQSGNNNVS